MSSDEPTESLIHGHKKLAEFLTERGYVIAKSTINKLIMDGRGPPIAGMWGNRHTFRPSTALAWARDRNLGLTQVVPTPVVSAPPIAAQRVPVEEVPPEPRARSPAQAEPSPQPVRVVDD